MEKRQVAALAGSYGAAVEALQLVKFLVWAVLNAFVVQIINNRAIHSARLLRHRRGTVFFFALSLVLVNIARQMQNNVRVSAVQCEGKETAYKCIVDRREDNIEVMEVNRKINVNTAFPSDTTNF